jgi:group I intron endonuclease
MIVYKVTNLLTNKIYIGCTQKSISSRRSSHLTDAKTAKNSHYHHHFKTEIRKFGAENFEWEIIEEVFSIEEMYAREKFWIGELNTIHPSGYNQTEGGIGGKPCQEVSNKISETLKNHFKDPKSKEHFKNRTKEFSRECGLKASASRKEKGLPWPSGYLMTEEAKSNMKKAKRDLYKCTWFNIKTQEKLVKSCIEMSEITGMHGTTFSHLSKGRLKATKSGWTFVCIGEE